MCRSHILAVNQKIGVSTIGERKKMNINIEMHPISGHRRLAARVDLHQMLHVLHGFRVAPELVQRRDPDRAPPAGESRMFLRLGQRLTL